MDNQKWTPLHYAASEGNLEMVKYLVEMKAKTNVKNNLGHTPRHTALHTRKKDWTKVANFLKPPTKKRRISALL